MTNKKMKTTSVLLKPMWEELKSIFMGFTKFNPKMQRRLEHLGYEVKTNGKHFKMYVELNGNKHMVLISSTPSDAFAGNQVLQEIRRIYERYEKGE